MKPVYLGVCCGIVLSFLCQTAGADDLYSECTERCAANQELCYNNITYDSNEDGVSNPRYEDEYAACTENKQACDKVCDAQQKERFERENPKDATEPPPVNPSPGQSTGMPAPTPPNDNQPAQPQDTGTDNNQ